MYFMNHPFRTTKCLFLALFLTFWACEVADTPLVVLDSGLKKHLQLVQAGKTGSARVQLRQWMEREGVSAQPLFLMGLSYHKEKKYTNAARWFEKSTTFEKKVERYPPAWHFLGWSYYYLGEIERSQRAFNQFLELHPDEGDTLFALGLLAMDSGNIEAAQDFYHRSISALEDQPKAQAKALARLGDAFVYENKFGEARELYEQAVVFDPDLYEAWYRLASTYIEEDQSLFQFYKAKSGEARSRLYQSRYQTSFPE